MINLAKNILIIFLLVIFATPVYAETTNDFLNDLVRLEADYILSCQYLNSSDPANGAINNVYGNPTWVVPRENAMAILGLIEARRILNDNSYLERAQLSADYLVSVQDSSDGAWFDQYDFITPVVLSKSPTQTAEAMIAFYKLGFYASRYQAMKKGAQFLMSCQDPANKGGNDDGLLGGGKDANGQYQSWRWASDNAFAYLALRAASRWAIIKRDFSFANLCDAASQKILTGINNYLYISDTSRSDYGVWYKVVDMNDLPQQTDFHEWINYAPQMLDIPARGVGSPRAGEWMHQALQKEDGACVWNDGGENNRKSPGYSFQAALSWLDLGQNNYSDAAKNWALTSGLWQETSECNGAAGGWIDWIENGTPAPCWQRFIDTSFYAIAVFSGGYDFRTWPTGKKFFPQEFSNSDSGGGP